MSCIYLPTKAPVSFEFPYRFALLEGGLVPYPIVPIYITTALFGIRRYDFIVDTGADLTTMSHFMISRIGLNKDNLFSSYAQGIGEKHIKIWEGNIKIEFCQKVFTIRCSFTDNDTTPLLLGKTDLFDKFEFYFKNKEKKLVVIPF